MQNLPLLINITLALVVAFLGGVLAQRLKLPTIVGYLLAGIAIGPFTPGFVGDIEIVRQLAELGVIFLMFGVGLHFSLQDLWKVRRIAFPGAILQTALGTLMGAGVSRLWGWSLPAGIVLGLAISVASTVVLLRGLMDHNLLNTSHGRVAIGWLVMEDILSVVILVLMPALVVNGAGEFDWPVLALTLLKAAAFAAVMFLLGSRLIPWLLQRVAYTQSRELFILSILTITLGTAMGAAYLFGVSLALGAFVAGAIVSQSHLSHQVGADLLPFREAFAVLFFVSIGMLVNPLFLWQNIGAVLALTALVVLGKSLRVLLIGLALPGPAKTFLVVAVGMSQIGEFSFILGESGLLLGILDESQYSLILATALISITINPLMYRLLPRLEHLGRSFPRLWKQFDNQMDIPVIDESALNGHVVVVGYGRVGKSLIGVLRALKIPHLLVEGDLQRIEKDESLLTPVLYGDAASSEVIGHAGLERAKSAVITLSDEELAVRIVAAIKAINPRLPVITRAASEGGIAELVQMGAKHVVHSDLEVSMEIIHATLLSQGYPLRQVHTYIEDIRNDFSIGQRNPEQTSLRWLMQITENIQLSWVHLPPDSPLVGITLLQANLRARAGASVVVILRHGQSIPNPKSGTVFEANDQIGLIGDEGQVEAAERLILGAAEQVA